MRKQLSIIRNRRCTASVRTTEKAMSNLLKLLSFFMIATVTACATMPSDPSVMSLPEPFDQFRMDDPRCRQFAFEQIGGAIGRMGELRITGRQICEWNLKSIQYEGNGHIHEDIWQE